jgi:hypothetical protein
MSKQFLSRALRFMGKHRCPRCRMPLQAEELECPACELHVVFINESGEVMIEMVSLVDPEDENAPAVRNYRTALALEVAGDMYMSDYLPTKAHRADVIALGDGSLGVRFSNRVALSDVYRAGTTRGKLDD